MNVKFFVHTLKVSLRETAAEWSNQILKCYGEKTCTQTASGIMMGFSGIC